MRRVIALRHAESIKNLEDIYGGNGKELTKKGWLQIETLNEELQEKYDLINEKLLKIYSSCNRVHVVATCQKIADYFGIKEILFDERYSPIKLGAFNGLSKEEQKQLYPEAVEALRKWNLGIGDINDFVVDDLEPASNHSQRITSFFNSLEDNAMYILVGTRSDISAIKNVILGNDPNVYMQYKYYETDYVGGVYFEIDDKNQVCNIEYL